MSTVEIRILQEIALVEAMSAMRQWLDHRRVEPTTFRYSFIAPGVLIRIDFHDETEAKDFADAFSGRMLPAAQQEAPLPAG